MNRIKIALLSSAIAVSSIISYGFVDSYFEISKNLDIFTTLFRELNIYYVDDTKPGELMKEGIDAMLKSLDPYTNYIPESEIEDYRFMTTGEYGGIGSMIRRKGDYVVIAEPYENFPAHKAGLMAGDEIIEINGKSAKGKSTSDLSKLLKGQANTAVKLLIKRPGNKDTFEKNLVREVVKVKDVPYYGVLQDSIGYISLRSFTESASKEVREAFIELKEKHNIAALILDLRGNGGGLLREAVNIVNLFVPKGEIIVKTKGKVSDWDRTHKALSEPLDLNLPLVVLINRSSASASEIVAGAIQDVDRGILVGNNSFGKGLVQQTRNLSYNAKLKVTVAKYYIPSGRCIQKIDYANRDKSGKAKTIPDSLLTKFKTKNGRTVVDGDGITPDIEVPQAKRSSILSSLIREMLIFDFATQYRLEHPTLASAKEFRLPENKYDDFLLFLKDKEYQYESKSEKLLNDFQKSAKEERYMIDLKAEYDQLKSKISSRKKDDPEKNKAEITRLIEQEIVSRYFFKKGRIENSLDTDPEIIEALKTLGDSALCASILNGSYLPKSNEK